MRGAWLLAVISASIWFAHTLRATAHPDVVDPEFAYLSSRSGGLSLVLAGADGTIVRWVHRVAPHVQQVDPGRSGLVFEGYVEGPTIWARSQEGRLRWIGLGSSPASSPDEKQVAFITRAGDVAVVNVDGTGHRRLVAAPFAGLLSSPTWSPDGQRIAFSTGGRIDVVKARGGGRRILAWTLPYGGSPTWSPDGRQLAYVYGTDEVVIVRLGGGPRRRVGRGREPAWSPDGRTLAFLGDRGQAQVAELATGHVRVISRSSYSTLAWHPSGGSLVAVSHGRAWSIRLADGKRRMIFGGGTEDRPPAWFHDGRRLAYGRDGLHVLTVDGNDRHRQRIRVGAVAASPDGKELLYQGDGDDSDEIFLLNLATGASTKLDEDEGAGDTTPGTFAWSTNGTIALTQAQDDPQLGLYRIVRRNGQARLEATRGQVGPLGATAPDFSPDGRSIAFTSTCPFPCPTGYPEGADPPAREIWIADVRTGNTKLVTKRGWDPSWLSDGQRLAYTSDIDGDVEIYTIRSNGRDRRRITNSPGPDVSPAARPRR